MQNKKLISKISLSLIIRKETTEILAKKYIQDLNQKFPT